MNNGGQKSGHRDHCLQLFPAFGFMELACKLLNMFDDLLNLDHLRLMPKIWSIDKFSVISSALRLGCNDTCRNKAPLCVSCILQVNPTMAYVGWKIHIGLIALALL